MYLPKERERLRDGRERKVILVLKSPMFIANAAEGKWPVGLRWSRRMGKRKGRGSAAGRPRVSSDSQRMKWSKCQRQLRVHAQ